MSIKIAISSYSFHRFGWGPEGKERLSFEQMIDKCAELGVDGIELLGVHFENTDLPYLYSLKQHAARNGIAVTSISAHHNFVSPDAAKRWEEIDKVARWVDVAREVGAFAVRAFGGRWGTVRSFQEFMAASGEEPPLEGYSMDDAFDWTADAFRVASYYAGRRGVVLALENHWGLTGTADGVLRILEETGSPWLKVALDTGNFNFRPDQYAEMGRILPHAVMVHAKTYFGGGMFYDANLDYRRIGRMLSDGGFRGYVSIEFEGKAHPEEGIRRSVETLREAFAGL